MAFADAPVLSLNPQSVPVTAGAVAGDSTPVSSAPLSVNQRLTRLENQVRYLDTLNQSIEHLQKRLAYAQGQIEELQHQVALLQEKAAQPVAKAEPSTTLAKATTTPKTAPTKLSTPAEAAAYDQAYQLLLSRQNPKAIAAFEGFIQHYPKSDRVGAAYYWLGELYLAQGDADRATQDFRRSVEHPNNLKAPDAMLKLASLLLANGDSAHAKQLFEQVVKRYPGTAAAQSAQQKLKTLT